MSTETSFVTPASPLRAYASTADLAISPPSHREAGDRASDLSGDSAEVVRKQPSQPVEIETSKNWTIEATKTGFDDLKQPITFEDRAEKTFVIALQERTRPVLEVAPPVAAAVMQDAGNKLQQASIRISGPIRLRLRWKGIIKRWRIPSITKAGRRSF